MRASRSKQLVQAARQWSCVSVDHQLLVLFVLPPALYFIPACHEWILFFYGVYHIFHHSLLYRKSLTLVQSVFISKQHMVHSYWKKRLFIRSVDCLWLLKCSGVGLVSFVGRLLCCTSVFWHSDEYSVLSLWEASQFGYYIRQTLFSLCCPSLIILILIWIFVRLDTFYFTLKDEKNCF